MLKKILAVVAMLYAAASFAAVDVNKASAADLDGIKGIGPSISTKILDERKKGNFKDWNDFIERTKGVGEGNAAKFSAEGMTVNGEIYKSANAMPLKVDNKKAKMDAKADGKAPAAATATATATAAPAAAPMAKADAKMTADEAKAKKAADKQARADAKKAKADEAKAKKDTKAAKADTAAAKPMAAASAAK